MHDEWLRQVATNGHTLTHEHTHTHTHTQSLTTTQKHNPYHIVSRLHAGRSEYDTRVPSSG